MSLWDIRKCDACGHPRHKHRAPRPGTGCVVRVEANDKCLCERFKDEEWERYLSTLREKG